MVKIQLWFLMIFQWFLMSKMEASISLVEGKGKGHE